MRDHLVAGTEERHGGVVQRLFAAGGDDDLVVLVVDAVIGAIAVADGALQLGDAGHRRVLRELLIQRRVRRVLDRGRRRKVRLAGAEVNHVDAFATQAIHGRRHLHRWGRCDPRGSIREFHA